MTAGAERVERRAAAAYRLVLPSSWLRVPLDGSAEREVRDLVRRALERVPPGSPPDEVARVRRQLEGRLLAAVRQGRSEGAGDLFLPVEPVAGVALPMSFVVAVVPSTADVPAVLATLLADEGTRAVEVGGRVAVRTERRLPDGAAQVSYSLPPADDAHWATVTCHVEALESAGRAAMVELFDAVVSTWRWVA